ncbi:MAG: hypothetical protein ACRD82_18985 [Blastocatellia bacterium]
MRYAQCKLVLAVAFSPDDKQLVSGEYDNSVRIYTRRRRLAVELISLSKRGASFYG